MTLRATEDPSRDECGQTPSHELRFFGRYLELLSGSAGTAGLDASGASKVTRQDYLELHHCAVYVKAIRQSDTFKGTEHANPDHT